VSHVNTVAFTILVVAFFGVTLVGFGAARWRPAEDPMHLNEWGLGGRGFGTFISWFLLGGDIYTAYTLIAVPALVYAVGAAGFYALAYQIVVYPIVFIFAPRLWSVARARGYVTPGEFVRGRYGSQGLGLAVTFTGILATMPYIALQLVGIESVLIVLGVGGSSTGILKDLPLIVAFIVLAAYTYLAGLRAPALIAFVKDTLVWVVVIVAILYIPAKLGGWGHIFGVASAQLKTINPATGKPRGGVNLPPAGEWSFATLALGSALALFMYPHVVTGLYAAKRRDVVRRNLAALPAFTLLLGLIALFGYMARAVPGVNAGVKANGGNTQLSVPLMFQHMFPGWFAGIGYAAIVIGALVPAAIMSIATANLFTRNVYKELLRPNASPAEETRVARLASLVMKVGALFFVLELNRTFSINLQLLGGIWIAQIFPAIVVGLYTRWFHRFALVIGWAVGMAYGTIEAWRTPGNGQAHFGASTAPILGHVVYIAIAALLINLVITTVLTLVFRAVRLPAGYDETRRADYTLDPDAPADGPVDLPADGPAVRLKKLGPRHAARGPNTRGQNGGRASNGADRAQKERASSATAETSRPPWRRRNRPGLAGPPQPAGPPQG
jgi:solute:Na+ symporter, SSS family